MTDTHELGSDEALAELKCKMKAQRPEMREALAVTLCLTAVEIALVGGIVWLTASIDGHALSMLF